MSTLNLSTYAEIVDVLDKLPLIVREVRRQRRMSLREMGTAVGCSFSTINRIEHGQDGNIANAILILRWLDALSGLDEFTRGAS